MKKIFLIGDSIRLGAHDEPGYGQILKEMLKEKAEVFYSDDNSRFAQYTLRYLHEWAKKVETDKIELVLWNNGLWDTLRLTGENEPQTPFEQYLYYLKRVYDRIKYIFPNAKVIFLGSTNVINELAPPDSTRDNEEIKKYNSGAEKLMNELGERYFDLFPTAEKIPVEMRTDWVHYKAEGSQIFAEEIYNYLVEQGELSE